jgi:hypothetical protein
MTFKGLTPFRISKNNQQINDSILRFECFQNGRLGFSKIDNYARSSKKGGGPRVVTNFIAKNLVSRWVSAPNTPPEI